MFRIWWSAYVRWGRWGVWQHVPDRFEEWCLWVSSSEGRDCWTESNIWSRPSVGAAVAQLFVFAASKEFVPARVEPSEDQGERYQGLYFLISFICSFKCNRSFPLFSLIIFLIDLEGLLIWMSNATVVARLYI